MNAKSRLSENVKRQLSRHLQCLFSKFIWTALGTALSGSDARKRDYVVISSYLENGDVHVVQNRRCTSVHYLLSSYVLSRHERWILSGRNRRQWRDVKTMMERFDDATLQYLFYILLSTKLVKR